MELFRIKHNSDTVIIYADYTSPTSNSAVLKAKKLSDNSDMASVVQFFVNGVADQATIRSGEWNMVGILFKNLLRFGERSDNRIDITGPFVVNNVSDYQIDQAAEDNNYTFYLWSQTLSAAPERTWTQVAAGSATWNNTLISETAGAPIKLDAAAIYSSYFGNSRISGNNDNYKVSISQNDYSSYVGIRSSLISVSPL